MILTVSAGCHNNCLTMILTMSADPEQINNNDINSVRRLLQQLNNNDIDTVSTLSQRIIYPDINRFSRLAEKIIIVTLSADCQNN
jgi:hypothetical protein